MLSLPAGDPWSTFLFFAEFGSDSGEAVVEFDAIALCMNFIVSSLDETPLGVSGAMAGGRSFKSARCARCKYPKTEWWNPWEVFISKYKRDMIFRFTILDSLRVCGKMATNLQASSDFFLDLPSHSAPRKIAFSAISNPLTLVRQPALAKWNPKVNPSWQYYDRSQLRPRFTQNSHNNGRTAIEGPWRPRAQHARLPPRLQRLRPSARIDCADDTRRVQDSYQD